MATVPELYRRILKPALDVIIPPRCPVCGEMVADDLQFCEICWPKLRFITEPACTACGRPFEFARADDMVCAICLARPPRHDGIRAAVVYDDVSRRIPIRLKYAGRIGLAKLIAHFLDRYVPQNTGNLLLVPVPLHRTRIWRRGFNQAALIARSLHDTHNIALALPALIRTKATPPLKGMTGRQRQKLLRGAIAVNPKFAGRISGRDVMLVDDVYTSGATTNACVVQLKKAGARSVTIYCWARVLREGEEGRGG